MSPGLEHYAEKAVRLAQDAGCSYCDARAEDTVTEQISIEDGQVQYTNLQKDAGMGIRVLNSGSWGFFSISEPKSDDMIRKAVENALRNSRTAKKREGIRLAQTPHHQDDVRIPVLSEPDLDELAKIGLECDERIRKNKRVIKSNANLAYKTHSKYFASSEGSRIMQSHTDVVAELVATAHESGLTESVNITEGGQGGIEAITKDRDIFGTAEFISDRADALLDARPAKEDRATVVMNPDFVSLLTHEILGHPSEADRVLGKEMAWAGGAWWSGRLGERIGSNALNVFDDPTMQGSLGHYKYDDEGVRAERTRLVEDGVLSGHMQNRETAEIFGAEPTANMRASSYRFMPLIRMACTCIGPGDQDPEEIIKGVESGYLVSNMRIPSIDMNRYNWSISCQWAQKIEGGEPTELLRDVIVSGTAPEFFASIDACGSDFTVRPITNCGKGDPMQPMAMGNGGPTVRGTATVRSVVGGAN